MVEGYRIRLAGLSWVPVGCSFSAILDVSAGEALITCLFSIASREKYRGIQVGQLLDTFYRIQTLPLLSWAPSSGHIPTTYSLEQPAVENDGNPSCSDTNSGLDIATAV